MVEQTLLAEKLTTLKKKEKVKYLILKTNQNSTLIYNHMVLVATFRAENNTFAERLRTAIQEDKTTQAILKKINQGDIKRFTKNNKFLLF